MEIMENELQNERTASAITQVSVRNTWVFRTAVMALKENDMLPIAPATGLVAYIPPLLCSWNVVKYMHH